MALVASRRVLGGTLAVAGVAAAAALVHRGIYAESSQLFAPSVWKGAGARRSVALTFDDGPSEATLELLDFLRESDIRATFFQCGMNAERHPAIAHAVAEAGHEIGNHTYSHARLCPQFRSSPNLRSPGNIFRELASTQHILERVTGQRPTLFRAPYGMRWFGLGAAQRRLGLLGVMWSVIGHDWEWPADRIAAHVLAGVVPGGIVCLHDGRDIRRQVDLTELLRALRIVVPELKRQGYQFETVSQLLQPDSAA